MEPRPPPGRGRRRRKKTCRTSCSFPFLFFFWPHTYEEGEKVIVVSFFFLFARGPKATSKVFFPKEKKEYFTPPEEAPPRPAFESLPVYYNTACMCECEVVRVPSLSSSSFFSVLFTTHQCHPTTRGEEAGKGGRAWRKMKHPLSIDMVLVGGESTLPVRGASRLHARLA